jgi:CBS-domain-containing membrane protein
MNVAFFLTPKVDVIWLSVENTVREAIEVLDKSQYTAVPLLNRVGGYVGAVSEGDLLRELVDCKDYSLRATMHVRLADVAIRAEVAPVGIDAQVEELFDRATVQNFVPVVDSRGVFIGIVRRREILRYCTSMLSKAESPH